MKTFFAPHISAFLLAASLLSAQAQQPKPKSQKEVDALQKVQAAAQANNADGEIQAINYVLENFADTEYKPMLLTMGMEAASAKGDQAQLQVFGERALEADPNNVQARVLLAESIAGRIRENDLDKEQNLKKAEDYANKALELLKGNPRPPPERPRPNGRIIRSNLLLRPMTRSARLPIYGRNIPTPSRITRLLSICSRPTQSPWRGSPKPTSMRSSTTIPSRPPTRCSPWQMRLRL